MPGAARPAGAQAPDVSIASLAAQTLLLQADQTATVMLDLTGTVPDDTEVAVVVHNRITGGRDQLRRRRQRLGVDGAVPGAGHPAELGAPRRGRPPPGVHPDDQQARVGDRHRDPAPHRRRLPGRARPAVRRQERRAGQARDVPRPLARRSPIEAPLRVAMVLPITGPPSLQTDGATALDAGVRAAAAGSRRRARRRPEPPAQRADPARAARRPQPHRAADGR